MHYYWKRKENGELEIDFFFFFGLGLCLVAEKMVKRKGKLEGN